MITRDEALALRFKEILHSSQQCEKKITRWRVNGSCKTWKRQPQRFRVPLKFGVDTYWELTERNCELFHLQTDCSVLNKHLQYSLQLQGVYEGASNE